MLNVTVLKIHTPATITTLNKVTLIINQIVRTVIDLNKKYSILTQFHHLLMLTTVVYKPID